MSSERKYCSRCGRYLLLHNFDKRAASIDGLRQACRRCRSLEYLEKKSRAENGNEEETVDRQSENREAEVEAKAV